MKGLGCFMVWVCKGWGWGVQGLLWCKSKGVQSKEARTHRNKDTPATKLFFVSCRSQKVFFL